MYKSRLIFFFNTCIHSTKNNISRPKNKKQVRGRSKKKEKKRRSHHRASLDLTAKPVFQQSNLLLCLAASASRARRPVLPVKTLKVAVRGLPFICVQRARQESRHVLTTTHAGATVTDQSLGSHPPRQYRAGLERGVKDAGLLWPAQTASRKNDTVC